MTQVSDPAARRPALIAAVAAAVLGLICFLPSVAGGFVYDDHRFYGDNAWISFPSILWRAFGDPACQTADLTHAGLWRPLRTLSFALDHVIGGPGNPFVPHLTNVLLHGASTFLLARLLTAWRLPPIAAFLGAAAFALHPAQVECVAWISSRGDVLAAAFLWAALLADLRSRRGPALALGVCALLSKEQAVVWPALAGLSFLLAGRPRRDALRAVLLPAAATVLFVVVRAMLLAEPYQEGGLGVSVGPTVIATMLGHQTWFAAIPVGSVFDWQLPLAGTDACPAWAVAASVATVATVAACAAGLILRSGRPAVAWFLVALAPTLFLQVLVPLNILVADRFLLFALPALSLAVAGAARRSVAGAAAATVVCGCFAVLTWQRVPVWHSDVTLWTDTAERSAAPGRAESWLGAVALREARLPDAIQHLSRATAQPGADGRTYFQLASVEEQVGLATGDAGLVRSAVVHMGRARERFATGARQEGREQLQLLAAVSEADLLLVVREDALGLAAVDRLVAAPRGDLDAFTVAEVVSRASRLAARLELVGDGARAARVRAWAEGR